ncbi:NADP-dependent 3-hydroxy acid dehydrogenase YdfG [Thermomonospora echinospora]|uniref:NADP-dependent 3-hydroxy acid dehydrogenase YdfG n=1 Tax=Thermomonospora echinospora TaxID=1992 RepID=A0A1H6D5Y8_9ACTN|nr:NADP-dependent 3-hydroxy acid dehydrogenase YdfG [Thermomonospora echinospora]
MIVVAGAGGPAGRAAVRRLAAAGARVVAADVRPTSWDEPGVTAAQVDLLDADGTREWARRVAAEHGRVDGLVHLVGGWRGGKRFADTDLADWAFLHDVLIRTLQHTTLAFCEQLAHSPDGRAVIVSQTGAQRPAQGNAAYAAAKAAAEAWMLALADSFDGTGAASAILVVKALLTDEMRERRPQAPFTGYTHVDDLADVIAGLWDRPATELNGNRIDLTVARPR